jgi:hypothetical protein
MFIVYKQRPIAFRCFLGLLIAFSSVRWIQTIRALMTSRLCKVHSHTRDSTLEVGQLFWVPRLLPLPPPSTDPWLRCVTCRLCRPGTKSRKFESRAWDVEGCLRNCVVTWTAFKYDTIWTQCSAKWLCLYPKHSRSCTSLIQAKKN